jgi:serine/threonine-protein kinase/endoribonuclease IRE1
MSPFTSSNGEQTRVFVGRKETSLLLIELETGRIKATLYSECPPEWEDEKKKVGLDLVDAISLPTQVYVGCIGAPSIVFCKNVFLIKFSR